MNNSKLLLAPVFLFCFSISIFCENTIDNNEYDIKNIPLQLLNNADAVIRKYDIKFEILDNNYAVEIVKKVVTIFSKDEQHYGRLMLWYDKFRDIDDLEGVIYNEDGEEVRDLEDHDIKDYSDFESYSVYSDNRVKFIELYYDQFPYTIEYTYEVSYNGYLSWPSWYSRYSIDPIEETSLEVRTPASYNLRFWCNEDNVSPDISEEGNQKIYKWQKHNILPLPEYVLEEDIEDFSTIVLIAPGDFQIGGYAGNMNTWKDFGLWYKMLSDKRDFLPESALKEINEKINSRMNTKQKIETLYSYMQSRTRYVSIQLGIGGWQPYDADYVHKNGYGDCKALSNYMVSIFKAAGITAYPVLIKRGYYRIPIVKEFPNNQFNHVIVCVPLEIDTIWLECTSQIIPPGNIGWENENRHALMVTPEGGIIIRTPKSNSKKNIQQKYAEVKLSVNGVAYTQTDIKWFGNQHDYVIHVADKSTPFEQEKWITNLLDVPDLKLKNYSFSLENRLQNEINLHLDLTLQRYGSVSGNRIFFNPNLMERSKSVPKDILLRTSPIRLRYPYLDVDTIKYLLPEKYKVEALPQEIKLETSFGSFTMRTVYSEDNSVIYIRSLEMKDYVIPAEKYYEYQKFFADIVKADKQQVVLIKSNR